MAKNGRFCPQCGQRDFDGRVRMQDLLAKFFSSLTHLDNKFVKMCWRLFLPARVTMDYFEGKIRRYPHPVQFFFIVMFFFLLLFSKQVNETGFRSTGGNFSLQISYDDTTAESESEKLVKKDGFLKIWERASNAKKYRAAIDSLSPATRTPALRLAIDSIAHVVDGPWEDAAKVLDGYAKKGGEPSPDSLTLNFVFSSVRISIRDLLERSPDEIIQRYNLQSWQDKTTVRQGIKSLKDSKSLIKQYVGSFGWAILVLIALMAFVLRLLYWRRGRYYVEHFVFLMHQQSGAFLLLTMGLLVHQFLFSVAWIWLPMLLWIGIALLIAMKRFYGESWGWTVAKWLLCCAVYVFGLLVLFIATLLLVFIVF